MRKIMKTIGYCIMFASLWAAASLFQGCDKSDDISAPGLSVRVAPGTWHAGDAVRFELSGGADFIRFYSGEKGNDYAFADRDRVYETQAVKMFFTTQLQNGSQFNNLKVKCSTDFSGDYTPAGIDAATWTDISDRFDLAHSLSTTRTPSGEVDIYDLFPKDGGELYLAYEYVIKAPVRDHGQRTNALIYDFELTTVTTEKESVLSNHVGAGWTFVRYAGFETEKDNVLNQNTERLVFSCAGNPTVDKNAWAISKGFGVEAVTNLGPDWGVPVKAFSDTDVVSYEHVFEEPGTYEAVFVASNVFGRERKESVVKVTVNIEE